MNIGAPTLKLSDLSVGYSGARKAAHIVAVHIEMELRAGELVCLLGPNGAGKSTLLRTIAGMQKPLAGDVFLGGENLRNLSKAEIARRLSVVLTDRVTVGLLTAYEIVALGRSPYTGWSGDLTEDDHGVVEEAIHTVGAESLANRYLNELSDGERQKIMMARALAQEPQLLVLDEITAFLDLPRRVEIMNILRDLAHRRDRAVLLSTHDLELALATADRVWLLPKDGVLVAGVPEDLVLGGAFAAAFASEGVRFDELSGSFATHPVFHSGIALSGEEPLAQWTRRALQRKGYEICADPLDTLPRVSVARQDGISVWDLDDRTQVQRHLSIEALLHSLGR